MQAALPSPRTQGITATFRDRASSRNGLPVTKSDPDYHHSELTWPGLRPRPVACGIVTPVPASVCGPECCPTTRSLVELRSRLGVTVDASIFERG